MSLATHVRTLGRGPGRSRDLSFEEARDAMALMLSGSAAPEAIGAVLMLMRMKGETADEIAGFSGAAQGALPALPHVDLDWPSYAAGRTRGLPWFLLAAKLVAQSGQRVLLHGWNGSDRTVRRGLDAVGITMAETIDEAAFALDRDGIAYLPLERLSPALFNLLNLRDVLGLRSCMNTVARMLNPSAANASVQGVFHPSYRMVQADAAARLGWPRLSVIKGGGGEFEVHPGKPLTPFGLRDGGIWTDTLPAVWDSARRLGDDPKQAAHLSAVWQGAETDAFGEAVVLRTAALAFDTLGLSHSEARAAGQWQSRCARPAA